MSTKPSILDDLVEEDDRVIVSRPRMLVALEAAWEIQALCKVLRTVVSADADMEQLAVRGISARMEGLDEIIMSALGDTVVQTKDIAYRLGLEREEVEA